VVPKHNSVEAVAIAGEKHRRRLVRKGIADLLRSPRGARGRRYVEVHDAPAFAGEVTNTNKTREVAVGTVKKWMTQMPSRWWFKTEHRDGEAGTPHDDLDRALRDVDAECRDRACSRAVGSRSIRCSAAMRARRRRVEFLIGLTSSARRG
jgi:hypothetical protein